MADDIDELLDEVESKFINSETRLTDAQESASSSKKNNGDGTEELDAAIHSICSIPDPIESSSLAPDLSIHLNKGVNRKCTVVYVGDSSAASGLSGGVTQRKGGHRKPKPSSATKIYTKKYFAKPVFELSLKDMEAENARRKQKEIIERLFEKKLAVVTDKMVLDVRKFKRIKSDVWSNFGDVRLLISEDEVKKFNIDHHVIHIGKEEVLLCKSFVACVKCSAVFSYESHSYGTSTLRSHLKSCGKQRYNRDKSKKPRRMTGALNDIGIIDPNMASEKPVFQEQMVRFRDHATKLQEQILLFFMSKLKSFSLLENLEFKDLLQTFVQIGATAGNVDLTHYLCSPDDLVDFLVNDVYIQTEEAFKNEIQFLYGLSFSASIWVDVVEKISYITLSCHYANEDGFFKSVMFHTSEFPYEHRTSPDVSKLFQDCMSLMHSDFKKLLVIDYSFNMVNAFTNSEQFIQCICYALNCAVQTVINALSTTDEKDEDAEKSAFSGDCEDPYAFACFVSLINQCRSLVLHFKENKLQSSLPKSLQMCSSTCWKSVLGMLESINSQWEHIVDILLDRNELELFYFDQELLSLVVDFLEIFRDGYKELSSLSNPTLNLVLPWVTKWKTHCLLNEDESPFLAAVKSFMSSSIDQEVVKRITVHHKLATMLDPRFKELQFLTTEDKLETRAQAEFMVRECHETLLMNGIDVHNISSTCDQFADLCDNMTAENENLQVGPNEEVEEYLAEHFSMGKQDLDFENKFNPLQYWVRAKSRYPYLSRVALWILSCPASALQTDDCFVGAEWMVTMHETDLPRKHMHKCLFVKSFKNFRSKT